MTITQLLLANLGVLLEGSETGMQASLLRTDGASDGRCANVLHLAMRLGECLHTALAGGASKSGGDEDSDSTGWEGLLLLLDLLGHDNEHRRRIAVMALGLVVACLQFLRTDTRLASEALNSSGILDPSSAAMEEDESGEEEELLAGGGGEEVEGQEDVLASGSGGASGTHIEVLGGGGGGGGGSSGGDKQCDADMQCQSAQDPAHMGGLLEASQHLEMRLLARIKAVGADSNEVNAASRELVGIYSKHQGVVQGLWLHRLVGMQGLPADVLDILVLRLRGALKTETEVELLLQYLQFLAKMPGVAGTALAKDVAQLVLRRRVLLQHLSSLPGATAALTRILHVGLTAKDSAGRDGNDSMLEEDELVDLPGSSGGVPLVVVRAGLQSLCLDNGGAGSSDDAALEERAELIKVLLPKKGALPGPALADEEMA